ncbi:hypothetical protein D3C74_434350 [compost metagenome]
MRIPISRVRSTTDTSMMFITPTPPTMREITAMAETSSVRVAVVFSTDLTMLSLLKVKKSFTPWRWVKSATAACSASAGWTPSLTLMVIWLKWLWEMRRLITAL